MSTGHRAACHRAARGGERRSAHRCRLLCHRGGCTAYYRIGLSRVGRADVTGLGYFSPTAVGGRRTRPRVRPSYRGWVEHCWPGRGFFFCFSELLHVGQQHGRIDNPRKTRLGLRLCVWRGCFVCRCCFVLVFLTCFPRPALVLGSVSGSC